MRSSVRMVSRHCATLALGSRRSRRVGHGDLDDHVLAGAQAVDGLAGVELGRRCQDHRVDVLQGEAFREVLGPVGDAPRLGEPFAVVGRAADHGHHLRR